MLKKICGLFLGLVVLAGSTCVTPTHASSAPPVIMTLIQAGVSGDAKQEFIILYNQSPDPVDITDWCLENKSLVVFACFAYDGGLTEYVTATLPPYDYATVVSKDFVYGEAMTDAYYSLTYVVTNQSSGSVVGGSDTVRLLDANGAVVDSFAWSTALTAGKAWARTMIASTPDIYSNTGIATDWSVQVPGGQPFNSVILTRIALPPPEDEPVDPAEDPTDDPTENEGQPGPQTSTLLNPYITELLANPSGSDAGKEYIELYNPNPLASVSLDDITIRIGFENGKFYAFPDGATIPPLTYKAFYSAEMGFTLTNTQSKVQLYKNTTAVGDAIEYLSAKDDEAWALIKNVWQYTSQVTPGAANAPSPGVAAKTKATATTAKKPCASNQFRNPATGRCKLISSTTSTLKPCKANQERNAETNRCRSVTKMSTADHEVLGVEAGANQTKWYYWAAIGGVVLLVIGYAVWEWRDELKSLFRRKTGLY